MSRKRFKMPKKAETFSLNITAMTDMFTVLLVFLLQSYGSSDVEIQLIDGLRLPTSVSEKNPVNGVKVYISPTELRIDNTILAKVDGLAIENTAIDHNDINFVKPLFDELQKVNQTNEAFAKEGKLLLQADKELPYSTLRKIMYTASMAGFPNVKLVTTVGN